jgi:hypothetical protein
VRNLTLLLIAFGLAMALRTGLEIWNDRKPLPLCPKAMMQTGNVHSGIVAGVLYDGDYWLARSRCR